MRYGLTRTFLTAALLSAATSALGQEADLATMREEALELVNAAREAQDLPTLEAGGSLNEAAQTHAEDMLTRDYYAHESPEGETVRDRYLAAGGSAAEVAAENIATCEGCPAPPELARVREFHEGWMQSPEHRENILAQGLERFGFGIAGSGDEIYAVQTFAGPGVSPALAPGETSDALPPEALAEQALAVVNRAREEEGLDPLIASEALDQVAAELADAGGAGVTELEGGLFELLPEDMRGEWGQLGVLVGECGGCGATAGAADVRYLTQAWLDDQSLRERILDPETTHLGSRSRRAGTAARRPSHCSVAEPECFGIVLALVK